MAAQAIVESCRLAGNADASGGNVEIEGAEEMEVERDEVDAWCDEVTGDKLKETSRTRHCQS